MEVLITDEATQIREKYIRAFVETTSSYYRNYIKNACCLAMDCVIQDTFGIVSKTKCLSLKISVFVALKSETRFTAFGIFIPRIESSFQIIGNILNTPS